jgi:hypothetical protein
VYLRYGTSSSGVSRSRGPEGRENNRIGILYYTYQLVGIYVPGSNLVLPVPEGHVAEGK